jgi:hypothetical protein
VRGGSIIAVAAFSCACSPSVVVTYSHCPVPVMLSTVDRVGGQRSQTRETGTRDVLSSSASFTQTTQQNGQFQYVYTETNGPMALTREVLHLTPNRTDVEASNVELAGVTAGTFMFPGYVKIWGSPEGRKVWVK